MKKFFLPLLCLFLQEAQAQNTYYWVGGSGTLNTTASNAIQWDASNWNTSPDGTGTSRMISATSDTLVFDGNITNITNKTVYIKNVPRDSTGQLKLINGINVYVLSTATGIASTGTVAFGSTFGSVVKSVIGTGTDFASTLRRGDYIYTSASTNMTEVLSISSNTDLTVAYDEGTAQSGSAYSRANALYIYGNPGLNIDTGCTLAFGNTQSGSTQLAPFVVALQPGATGLVKGNFNFLSRGNAARLVAFTPGSLQFAAGSNCNISISGGKYYLTGNTCGTGSASLATFTFDSGGPAIVFQYGSNYRRNNVQACTPFGVSYEATTPLVFSPPVAFMPGSNFYYNYSNGYQPYFVGTGMSFGNLIWNSAGFPGTSGTVFYFNPARLDTLQLLAMNAPANATNTGRIVLYGDYINSSASTCNMGTLVFAGTGTVQQIAGSNTTCSATSLTVSGKANVKLLKGMTATSQLNVLGTLNTGNYILTGGGINAFTLYGAYNQTFNTPAGSAVIGRTAAVLGSRNIAATGVSTIPVGTRVSSASHPLLFPAGTVVVSYNGSGSYTLSNQAAFSADSSSTPTLSLTFSSDDGTMQTANSGGISGSLNGFGTTSFNQNAHYIFDGATATPFPATPAIWNMGSLTVNQAITLNTAKAVVFDSLVVNAAISIPESDTIRLSAGAVIAGSEFSNTKHIVTQVNTTTGAKGILQADNVTGTRLFPVGSPSGYLPVTLTPGTAATYYISAYEGLTSNGAPGGNPFSTNADRVNAVWSINRATSSSPCSVTVGWPASLEGSNFNSFPNTQIGISRYNGSTWDIATGSGDNIANTATGVFTAFSSFAVGMGGFPLSLSLVFESVRQDGNSILLHWKALDDNPGINYVVEKSLDGKSFTAVGSVKSLGYDKNDYSWRDQEIAAPVIYYRIKAENPASEYSYSNVLKVNISLDRTSLLRAYPNPATDQLYIEVTDGKQYQVDVTDNIGRRIMHLDLQKGKNIINTSLIAAGAYMLVVDGAVVNVFTVIH